MTDAIQGSYRFIEETAYGIANEIDLLEACKRLQTMLSQDIVNMQHQALMLQDETQEKMHHAKIELVNFNDFFLEDLPPTVCSGKPPEYQALVHELLPQLSMFYSKLDPGMTRACGMRCVRARRPFCESGGQIAWEGFLKHLQSRRCCKCFHFQPQQSYRAQDPPRD